METPLPVPPMSAPQTEKTAIDQNGNVLKKGDQIAVALTGLLGGFILDLNEHGIVLGIPLFTDIAKPVSGLLKAHQRRYDQPPNQS